MVGWTYLRVPSSQAGTICTLAEEWWNLTAFENGSLLPVSRCTSLSPVGMPCYCCSSSDFLQSHYTVLLFFMHLLMLLFTSLYFSDPLGSNLFSLSSLLLSHRSRISAVIQGFFLLTMFAKDLASCFSHCCVEGGDH